MGNEHKLILVNIFIFLTLVQFHWALSDYLPTCSPKPETPPPKITFYSHRNCGWGYHLSTDVTLNWADARSTCASYGWDLTSIDSYEEFTYLSSLANEANTSSSKNFWTSGNDLVEQHIFRWNFNGDRINVWWPFGSDQPDNRGGNERCIGLAVAGGTELAMHDFGCIHEFLFICKETIGQY